jgi:hypothetical protein
VRGQARVDEKTLESVMLVSRHWQQVADSIALWKDVPLVNKVRYTLMIKKTKIEKNLVNKVRYTLMIKNTKIEKMMIRSSGVRGTDSSAPCGPVACLAEGRHELAVAGEPGAQGGGHRGHVLPGAAPV